jgi:ABC-type uncharacterized transport system ATPase subunit
MGKMEDVSKSGRTILFVSHDLGAVETICSKAILLNKGGVELMGASSFVVSEYLKNDANEFADIELSPEVVVRSFVVKPKFDKRDCAELKLSIQYQGKVPTIHDLCILIYTSRGVRAAIVDLRPHFSSFAYREGEIVVHGDIKNLNLVEGDYNIGLYFVINQSRKELQNLMNITILSPATQSIKYQAQHRGIVETQFEPVL